MIRTPTRGRQSSGAVTVHESPFLNRCELPQRRQKKHGRRHNPVSRPALLANQRGSHSQANPWEQETSNEKSYSTMSPWPETAESDIPNRIPGERQHHCENHQHPASQFRGKTHTMPNAVGRKTPGMLEHHAPTNPTK
jgi:hypothetical protein